MTETIGLDFEFFDSNEPTMKVIAAVIAYPTSNSKYNLLDKSEVTEFLEAMYQIQISNKIILAYAAGAEARGLLSLGIDPLQFKWKDLYAEFIMLCNSNDRYQYGDYVGDNENICFSTPPNPNLSEEEKELDTENHRETPKNLINAVYKVLEVRLDAKEKTAMRDLILSKDLDMIQSRMGEILDYCASDTKYLRALDIAIQRAFEKEGLEDFENDQLDRGRYSVCMGITEHSGMPINMPLLNKIIEKTPEIIKLHEETVNGFFPLFVSDYQRPSITRKNGKIFHYILTPAHKDMAAYQKYVESLEIRNFPKTKTGQYKADKDTLEAWGYWQGLEALWKCNRIESSLKWFKKDNKDGFFERLGTDNRIRPYFGIFGTQTGRNAAKTKTFPLAMSSWLRCIIQPNKGTSIIGADFSQQEVYVAAILSGDGNLLSAYESGDVYFAFAKQAGLVPDSATKKSHKAERDLCKSTVLGLQFGMGAQKLQTKLTLDSGKPVTMDKTRELINAHKTVFSTYWNWVYDLTKSYKKCNPLSTNDGWVLWCDNPVITSVRNFPVQGNAASITRRAVVLAIESGLKVIASLHDAIYIESDSVDRDQLVLKLCMELATEQILKETKTKIRLDFKTIGHDDIWIEEKAEKDWDKLKGFLL